MALLAEILNAGKRARLPDWGAGVCIYKQDKLIWWARGLERFCGTDAEWMRDDWREYQMPRIYERWLVVHAVPTGFHTGVFTDRKTAEGVLALDKTALRIIHIREEIQ